MTPKEQMGGGGWGGPGGYAAQGGWGYGDPYVYSGYGGLVIPMEDVVAMEEGGGQDMGMELV